ncbi:glycosyltransferase [Peribacillus butanolivorans]|uniref:glycosyltransferase n=1 Tax=Peribacillus butanolivorans TaxID=421767 RepID=UPI0036A79F69
MKKKSITVFYSSSIKLYNGEFYCNGGFGRFFSKLTEKYDKVYLCAPCIHVNEQPIDFKIIKKNWELQKLPQYTSYIGSFKFLPAVIKKIIEYSKVWSKLYIRFPSPFALTCALIASFRGVDFVLHVVGDTKVIVNQGTKYKGITKLAANVYCHFHDYSIRALIKISRGTLFNGSGMRRIYGKPDDKIKEIRTSTFDKSEIFYRNDNGYSNILFVGYLRHEKGVPILLDALNYLPESYRLTIVGNGPERENLESKVNENSYIKERVIFKGHIPLGEELFNEYKNANIFVLPSISEGTPRVVVEAMAFGNLIVASNTGGIPYTVSDNSNGLLFEVGSPKDLAKKIKLLQDDNDLREKLRNAGYNLANANTLDSHVDEVYNFIQEKTNKPK